MCRRIHFERRIRLQVGLVPGGDPHLDAGEDEESAEDVEDPVELRDQPGADQDHDGAQHERAHDAEHQHALLVGGRHREVREHEQEHEDVVDRERLFDQVAGHELERLGLGDRIAVESTEVPPEPGDEDERDPDPDQRPHRRFLHRDLVGPLLLHREEVDDQRDQHEGHEQGPQQRRASRHHQGMSLQ